MNEQENMHTPEPSLLEALLPSFMHKLDSNGCLDLTDRIPANAYQGCGIYVLAIDPENGSIHNVCDGTENGSPYIGGLTEKSEKLFFKFAWAIAKEGYVPVICMFSQWTASGFSLCLGAEFYEDHPLLESSRVLEASEAPKAKQMEFPFEA